MKDKANEDKKLKFSALRKNLVKVLRTERSVENSAPTVLLGTV